LQDYKEFKNIPSVARWRLYLWLPDRWRLQAFISWSSREFRVAPLLELLGLLELLVIL
jgi:hypothetical protein